MDKKQYEKLKKVLKKIYENNPETKEILKERNGKILNITNNDRKKEIEKSLRLWD